MLQKGGNALDAAVTVGLCQGIMSPANSGLGGGGLAVVRLQNGTVLQINGRERAPAAATSDMFGGKWGGKAGVGG